MNIGGVIVRMLRKVELSFSYSKSSLGMYTRAAPMAEGSLLVGVIKRRLRLLSMVEMIYTDNRANTY